LIKVYIFRCKGIKNLLRTFYAFCCWESKHLSEFGVTFGHKKNTCYRSNKCFFL